jgi:toxin FitB
VNLVDSSGWLEYLTDGVNAKIFESPLRDSANLLIPTICVYEVFKRILLEYGEERALDVIGLMSYGQVVELSRELSIEAARISVETKLAMADSIILASARLNNAALWTQDSHFKDIETVKYIPKKW